MDVHGISCGIFFNRLITGGPPKSAADCMTFIITSIEWWLLRSQTEGSTETQTTPNLLQYIYIVIILFYIYIYIYIKTQGTVPFFTLLCKTKFVSKTRTLE